MFDRYLNLGGKIIIFLLNFDFPLWIKKIEWNAGVHLVDAGGIIFFLKEFINIIYN